MNMVRIIVRDKVRFWVRIWLVFSVMVRLNVFAASPLFNVVYPLSSRSALMP